LLAHDSSIVSGENLRHSTFTRSMAMGLLRSWRPIGRPVVMIVKPVLVLASDGRRIAPLRAVLDGFPGEVDIDFGVRPTYIVEPLRRDQHVLARPPPVNGQSWDLREPTNILIPGPLSITAPYCSPICSKLLIQSAARRPFSCPIPLVVRVGSGPVSAGFGPAPKTAEPVDCSGRVRGKR